MAYRPKRNSYWTLLPIFWQEFFRHFLTLSAFWNYFPRVILMLRLFLFLPIALCTFLSMPMKIADDIADYKRITGAWLDTHYSIFYNSVIRVTIVCLSNQRPTKSEVENLRQLTKEVSELADLLDFLLSDKYLKALIPFAVYK